ncbi:cell division protein FtsQ [Lachnotalea glycerini]|uniref:Cell division protein FtsQ n=1 Tax=Lachnotalea glycerini TaxID=1763509 RepID=A0A255IM55_9FIRM|nr:cell division protein FtsQ/DivIB [Lachnotalea glycerini]PXV89524.1 cell division protein FtsQ [Lachnotalea glycerini]RDY32295.1 cell division protein FtsQ [Lachnotalea glycerini]
MIRKNKRRRIIIILIAVLLAAVVITIVSVFSVKKITITGNEHYTEEEIKKLIFSNRYCYNSLYLYWKYNYRNDYLIPFIDTIEVEMISGNEVKINVYEKSLVGYIEYLGSCMYFDKDGIVVESSSEAVDKVPLVTGLKFDHIILYQKLPVEEKSVFNTIVSVTQLLSKYEITPDKVYFNSNYEMTFYFADARVYLGKDKDTEEKIIRLKSILPDLEGLSGVLHMEDYQEGVSNITFEKDK